MAEDGAVDGFDLLADETRVAILETLADELSASPGDPGLSLSAICRRIGRRDSGNVHYHLDQLCGRFVRQTDAGYVLLPSGMQVVTAVRAGRYSDAAGVEPSPLAGECGRCGGSLTVAFEDGMVEVTCDAGHSLRNLLPPGVVSGRSPSAAAAIASHRSRADVDMARRHGCPHCFGAVAWAPADRDDLAHVLEATCDRCGLRLGVPVGMLVADHPAVVAAYHEQGVDVRARPLWELPFYGDEAVERVADEPPAWVVAVPLDGETLRLRVAADASITVVAEPGE